jgi:hypothetical protein
LCLLSGKDFCTAITVLIRCEICSISFAWLLESTLLEVLKGLRRLCCLWLGRTELLLALGYKLSELLGSVGIVTLKPKSVPR